MELPAIKPRYGDGNVAGKSRGGFLPCRFDFLAVVSRNGPRRKVILRRINVGFNVAKISRAESQQVLIASRKCTGEIFAKGGFKQQGNRVAFGDVAAGKGLKEIVVGNVHAHI